MPNPATLITVGSVGASAYTAREARRGAESAGRAQESAALAGVDEQREARQAFEERTQPFLDIGLTAQPDLYRLLGITTPRERDRRPEGVSDLEVLRDRSRRRAARARARGEDDSVHVAEVERLEGEIQSLLDVPSPWDVPEAIDLSQLPSIDLSAAPSPSALDLSQLPAQAEALNRAQLPAAPEAFGPESFRDNPLLDFVLEEGFRGIREGAAGGGRVPDRDLVKFAQGTASTILPQLQAQQFGQQQALRGQALGEQAQQFGQQQDIRGRGLVEQAQQFGQQAGLRGITLGEQQALRGQALAEQAQQFGQLGGIREALMAEEQQDVANLMNLLGLGQATAVGQGQAALQTGSNISGLLGNIGTAQAGAALGSAQANQQLAGNLTGLLGAGLGYSQSNMQQAQPYGGSQMLTTPPPAPQPILYAT